MNSTENRLGIRCIDKADGTHVDEYRSAERSEIIDRIAGHLGIDQIAVRERLAVIGQIETSFAIYELIH